MRLPRRLILLSLPLALLPTLHVPAWAAIPAAALLKTADPHGSGKFVFPASSAHVLDPAAPRDGNGQPLNDHALAIQNAIDAVAKVVPGVPSNLGAVILVKPGTYHLKRSLIIRGRGVTLVGLRNLEADGTWGAYPTFTYGDDLVDEDYDDRADIEAALFAATDGEIDHVDVLEHRAAVRINGNADYGDDVDHSIHGLRGFNIQYIGTSATSHGGQATAVTVQAVYHSPVQDVTIGGTHHGPYNGIDVGTAMMPLVHNVTITGVRGDFGLRAGNSRRGSHAQKYHGLTITAPVNANSETDLIRCRGESEFIGARLEGGGIGVNICGEAINDDHRIGNITLRSVLVKNTADQGIVVNNAQAVILNDIQIDDAGAEGIKVGDPAQPTGNGLTSGFLGGLQMLNIRVNHAGLSAIRVHTGMNISLANAVLLNSGQDNDLTSDVVAGIYLDAPVTSFNVVGARIGYSESISPPSGKGEDWGIYWSPDGAGSGPWRAPTIIATHVNFFSNITAAKRTNDRPGLVPAKLSITHVNGYNALAGAGYFPSPVGGRVLLEDEWPLQKLPTDPEFADSWLRVAKGYNWFDLPEIRDVQWIDLTLVPDVVTSEVEGVINSSAFEDLVEEAAVEFPEGVVLYLPAGRFTGLNTSSPGFTRRLFKFPAGGAGLYIDKPKVQLLGSGHAVTQISVPHETENTQVPPIDDVITFADGSDGSGVFGLSINYDNSAYKTPAKWAEVVYGAAFRVENTEQIRLVNLGSDYGMGSTVTVVNSKDCSLYQIWARTGVNNKMPEEPLGVFRVIGTSLDAAGDNATEDIRLFQVFSSGLSNIDPNPDPLVVGSPLEDWNEVKDDYVYATLPEMDHVRIEGAVSRVRIDYSTFIQGKNGLTVTSRGSFKPTEISGCRMSTDHVKKAFNLLHGEGAFDFLACWTNAAYNIVQTSSLFNGDVRFSNMAIRGGNFEGAALLGGGDIDLVNCQVGRTCNSEADHPDDRLFAGVYVGDGVAGNLTMVGGLSGWLWFRFDAVPVTSNGNRQDWGVMLGKNFPESRYISYGVDLFGNDAVKARKIEPTSGAERGLGKVIGFNPVRADWLTNAPNHFDGAVNAP